MRPVDELCELLGIGEEETEGLALAVEDPAAYVEAFAERLDERGITKPVANLRTLALADALQACDLALVLDWRFDPEDVVEGLRTVLGEVADELDVDDVDPEDPIEALEALQAFVEGEDKALFQLGLDEDAYELFFVDGDEADRAQDLLDELKIEAGPF
ncbi:MAG: hypothetical protein EP330_11410 [Deltaproteobacteria bacterium]|nr:MAG: hypothetical protein EP330_11410 [Deltaproteobacteria bacterium]